MNQVSITSPTRDSEKPTVIFVDDDINFVSSLKRSFQKMKNEWNLEFCVGGVEAMECLEGIKDACIVTDWMMPDVSGLDICRNVKKEKEDACRYTIVLTGKVETNHAVTALAEGADDFLRKPFDVLELGARITAGLRTIILQRRLIKQNAELAYFATTDELTGFCNRRKALHILNKELSRVKRGKQDLSLIMFDIDHFKKVNDSFGHKAGDDVLREIANRCNSVIRRYDSAIRWGGEEFLIICPHARQREGWVLSDRLRKAFSSKPFSAETSSGITKIDITASFGIVSAESGSRYLPADILSQCDQAVYAAKDQGRDRVVYFGDHLDRSNADGQ